MPLFNHHRKETRMSRRELGRLIQSISSFEDLSGLRAEGYVKDSKVDQSDGFGTTIQKTN